MMLELLLWALGAWVAFNWAAPFAVLVNARRMGRGRIPGELLEWSRDHGVRFYTARLIGGYGFSVWAPPWSIVVFDEAFFARASPHLVRFVIAHELAHFSLGHHRKRWFAVVSGFVLLSQTRKWLAHMEAEADVEAERQTGYGRSLFPQLGGHHEE